MIGVEVNGVVYGDRLLGMLQPKHPPLTWDMSSDFLINNTYLSFSILSNAALEQNLNDRASHMSL